MTESPAGVAADRVLYTGWRAWLVQHSRGVVHCVHTVYTHSVQRSDDTTASL